MRMKAILLALALSVCVHICCGRHINARFFEYEPRKPLRDSAVSADEAECKDDPDYADGCPEMAAITDYCSDQEKFMREHCNKSCNFCEEEATTQTPVSTESPKAPAPAVSSQAPAPAATTQPPVSTESLQEPAPAATTQPPVLTDSPQAPAPAVTDQCEDDPAYAADCPTYAAVEGYCKEQKEFMRENCAKSCNFSCEGEATTQPPVSTESSQASAPAATTQPPVSTESPQSPVPAATTQPPVSTESPKAPAPAVIEVCEDDPDYADGCPEMAAVDNYCFDQEDFMRKHCNKSCDFCKGEVTAKPPAPAEVCKDDPDYADGCPGMAAIQNYCSDQKDFMTDHCPKSCNFCKEEATTQPPVVTVQPPAPIECADDPALKETCEDMAATDGLCQEQEQFTKENCKLSCGWCVSPPTKAATQEICEEDLPKWKNSCPKWAEDGECEDPSRQVFMEHYCPKSCNLPCPQTEPSPKPNTNAPSPPAFCRDRDVNCKTWKSLGKCEDPNPKQQLTMAIYCGITCDTCKAPTPEECYDKADNCEQLKEAGFCDSTVPTMEYEVKTNCLETCEFCVPDFP